MSPIYDPEALAAMQGQAPAPSAAPPLPPELVREELSRDTTPMQWSSDAI